MNKGFSTGILMLIGIMLVGAVGFVLWQQYSSNSSGIETQTMQLPQVGGEIESPEVSQPAAPKTSSTPREANKYENEYYSLALYIESPELCYKIFSKAYVRTGEGDSYMRSDCFLPFAVDQKRPELCKEVALGNGERYSEQNCLKQITPGPPHSITVGAASDPRVQLEVFTKMGYDEKLASEKVNAFFMDTGVFLDFIRSKDFAQRISRLSTFTE